MLTATRIAVTQHLFVSYVSSVCNLSSIVQESIESANTTIEDDDVKGRRSFCLRLHSEAPSEFEYPFLCPVIIFYLCFVVFFFGGGFSFSLCSHTTNVHLYQSPPHLPTHPPTRTPITHTITTPKTHSHAPPVRPSLSPPSGQLSEQLCEL